jgi:hypothetical protein
MQRKSMEVTEEANIILGWGDEEPALQLIIRRIFLIATRWKFRVFNLPKPNYPPPKSKSVRLLQTPLLTPTHLTSPLLTPTFARNACS